MSESFSKRYPRRQRGDLYRDLYLSDSPLTRGSARRITRRRLRRTRRWN